MKIKLFLISALMSFLLFPNCSPGYHELIYDEIIYAEYRIVPFTNSNDLSALPQPFYKNKNQDKIYIPLKVLKLSKDGSCIFFQHTLIDSTKNGDFKLNLTLSDIEKVNSLLKKLNNNKMDTAYFSKEIKIYDNSYYYLSILNKNQKEQTHIYSLEEAPDNIKALINYLEDHIVTNNPDPIGTKNTLDELNKKIYESDLRSSPLKIKYDGEGDEHTPNIDELKILK